jgi:muramidase (phage lysozyme)
MNNRGQENLKLLKDNPNLQKMLYAIHKAEGTKGYNSGFNNTTISLDKHPNIKYDFTDANGKKDETTAAGMYQFIGKTWKGLEGKLGLTNFGKDSQDAGAIELIREKGALQSVLAGDYQTAMMKMGGTWASLPYSKHPQNKRTLEQMYSYLGEPAPKSPVFLELLKDKGMAPLGESPASPAMEDVAPYQAAEAPIQEPNWQENLARAAMIRDADRRKERELYNLFAEAGVENPDNNAMELPDAVLGELSSIISKA